MPYSNSAITRFIGNIKKLIDRNPHDGQYGAPAIFNVAMPIFLHRAGEIRFARFTNGISHI